MVMVTKREAARLLIRGALRALKEGDEVCSLTLAGAAEEAMPRADSPTGYDVMKAIRVWMRRESEKAAGNALNAERNWLKHHNADEAPTIEIDAAHVMLLRAMSRYMAVYGFDDLTREYGDYMGWPPDYDP